MVAATADQSSLRLLTKDECIDEGVHSEQLIFSGSSLYDIGTAFAWIYLNTRLSSLCQGTYHYFVRLTLRRGTPSPPVDSI